MRRRCGPATGHRLCQAGRMVAARPGMPGPSSLRSGHLHAESRSVRTRPGRCLRQKHHRKPLASTYRPGSSGPSRPWCRDPGEARGNAPRARGADFARGSGEQACAAARPCPPCAPSGPVVRAFVTRVGQSRLPEQLALFGLLKLVVQWSLHS